jgi:hypothetical protein
MLANELGAGREEDAVMATLQSFGKRLNLAEPKLFSVLAYTICT